MEVPLTLIDISNSRTKVAVAGDVGLGEKTVFTTADLAGDVLLPAAASEGVVVLSSVVPDKTEIMRKIFGGRLLEVNHTIELGIAIDYPEPETIGADRLANAAALAARGAVPGVVVDFGTAVTFDIVSGESAYVGGVITPGLEVMTDYMYQRTALLPRIDLMEPTEIVGKSTRHAMLSGVIYGYRGLVREILTQIRQDIAHGVSEEELHTVATGGYASLIAVGVPEIRQIDSDLTLEGLRIIGMLNA